MANKSFEQVPADVEYESQSDTILSRAQSVIDGLYELIEKANNINVSLHGPSPAEKDGPVPIKEGDGFVYKINRKFDDMNSMTNRLKNILQEIDKF